MERVRILAPALAGTWLLLAEQGARIGPYVVPRLSWWWVVLVVAAFFFSAPKRPVVESSAGVAFTGLAIFAAVVASSLWRSAALGRPLDLVVRSGESRDLSVSSLQLERRRDLRRMTGKRRNVRLEARAILEVPRDGEYRFELACDDACALTVSGRRVLSGQTLSLTRGEHPFTLRYRQAGGPASLLFGWDGPRAIELLPIEYFIHAPGRDSRSAGRRRANASLLFSIVSWGAFSIWISRAAPFRHQLFGKRWAPVAAAAIVVLYGSLLRFEAFLVHSGLTQNEGPAAVIHETLVHFAPPYASFNPASAPDDPYRADVRSYLDRAESFEWRDFYAPSFREPFYIALSRPFLALAGGEIGILIQSLFFSCASLVLFFFLARDLHGSWWAAALLVPLALHEWLVREAPSGYRMSAYAFWLLASVFVMFRTSSSRPAAALAGGFHGLLCLLRLSALSVVAPLLWVKAALAAKRERGAYAAVFLLVLAALVGPFLVTNAVTHGDPFYSISFHTEFWLHAEGLDAKAPVSFARYFTDFGRTGALLRGTFLGMTAWPVRTFFRGLGHFPVLNLLTLVLGIFGLALSLWSTKRFLAAAYLGHLIPFAYIQNFPSGEMPRFVMPAYFFVVLAVPVAARAILTQLRPAANVETS